MCGSGSTGVVASLRGRHAVQVDIEKKFVDWAEEARRKVERQATLTSKGFIRNICGDARRLSELLKQQTDIVMTSPPYSETMGEVDAVITSPPYAESLQAETDYEKRKERLKKAGFSHKTHGLLRGQETSSKVVGGNFRYSKDKENIGNLPFQADAVITSPPFANGFRHNPQDKEKRLQKLIEVEKNAVKKGQKWAMSSRETLERRVQMQDNGYGENKENIGNLPFQPDAIITSPPYAHESTATKPTKLERQGLFKMGHSKEEAYTEEDYRKWDKREGGNIGKKRLFIRVPCTKEEAEFHDAREGREGTIWEWTKEVEATQEIIEKVQKLKSKQKGKSETYLEAMLKCYCEMWKVLKPQGLCIVVIKPFIRNKKVVDLPYHTWLLLKKAGFKLVQLFKLRLKQESFWRILYSKKFPDVPKIKHEYILVCEK